MPAKPESVWYGREILIPEIISEATLYAGLGLVFNGLANHNSHLANDAGTFGGVLMLAGGLGHAFSGPIVHLTNGQPMQAGLSFLMQDIVPAGVITAAVYSRSYETIAAIVFAVLPITGAAGIVVDSVFLARKKPKPETKKDSDISLAPLVFPKLNANSGRPVGLGLVGRF